MGVKATYRAESLAGALLRDEREDAEADELRGVEFEAFVAVLPTLTGEQWSAALSAHDEITQTEPLIAAWDAMESAAKNSERALAVNKAIFIASRATKHDGGNGIGLASAALVVRDLISTRHFDVLTGPMRAAGIDFDALVAV